MLIVSPSSLGDVERVHALIPEFSGPPTDFRDRLNDKEFLALLAQKEGHDAGYAVSYRLDADTVYIWMVGVVPEFRKAAVWSRLFEETLAWARQQGFRRVRLKTRNTRRQMLAWLVKNDFRFIAVEPYPDSMDNRILTEKNL